jgi:UDP-galactopyranose mutase
MTTIIVFSYLRWDFMVQRPQHIMARLAKHYRIVFIEEPVYVEGQPASMQQSTPAENITVCTPHTPSNTAGFHDDQLPYLRKLLHNLVAKHTEHIAWLYTPMALPLLAELRPGLIIYDCMEDLASLKDAPRQMVQRETALLRQADLVFTAGPSLYRAKCGQHPRVSCFPNSVDASHFFHFEDRSRSHMAQQSISHPRAGFHGAIDDRFDTALIAQLADARPQLQIVLVGPIVDIDPLKLPQRPNIHYFRQQSYRALPHFLADWDISLLPFTQTNATRHLSPYETLEYMAAQLPVVATKITDVADLYGSIIRVAGSNNEFIEACDAALNESPEESVERKEEMRIMVAKTSWDRTVADMLELIEELSENMVDSTIEEGHGRAKSTAAADHARSNRASTY